MSSAVDATRARFALLALSLVITGASLIPARLYAQSAPGLDAAATPVGTAPAAGIRSLSPPRLVGDLTLVETQPFDRPELGTLYIYSSETDRIDLYVYPAPRSQDGSARAIDEVLRSEGDAYIVTLPEVNRRKGVDAYHVALDDEHPVQVGSVTVSGRFIGVALREGQEIYVSFYYLFWVHGQLVKVRNTVPEARWGSSPAHGFATDIVTKLQGEG